ncbi:MAG: hypothetical protein INR62_14190, partial [Rhodospirillales bacterium]|nr:hypothetical protein [Acetobacter sp.]
TLGGVMLLLEAHIAFFDDLPAKFTAAAQQIQTSLGSIEHGTGTAAPPPSRAARDGVSAPKARRQPSVVACGLSAAILCTAAFSLGRHLPGARPIDPPSALREASLVHVHLVSIEPWNDPVTHQRKGCVVSFAGAASAESTSNGEAKVYLLSPVDEVRQNLKALKHLVP